MRQGSIYEMNAEDRRLKNIARYEARVRQVKRIKRTMIAVAAATAKRYESVRLGICCSSATSPLYKPLEERLRAAIDNIASVQVKDISADLIVHTGPDLVGVGVQNAAL